MTDEINKQIEKLIASDPWLQHVVKILKGIHGNPLPQVIALGFLDVYKMGSVPQKQITQWIGNYLYVGERILKSQAGGSDYSVFWIRLYEIVDFLPEYFEQFHELGQYTELEGLVQSIQSLFTPEELVMIEYQRNCHAHIHQSGYRIKVNYDKQGNLKDNGLFYKGQLKTDLKSTIEQELKNYGVSEEKMALSYFQKTQSAVDKLWQKAKEVLLKP